jgi:methylmalonyl-CoA mutase N-terminal domain/subunit
MDPAGLQRQTSRLQALRKSRDAGAVGQALDALRLACQGTENTMPRLLQAVRVYATLGEIIEVMRGVFGTYQEPTWV